MPTEEDIRAKLFGKKHNEQLEELNKCPGCGSLFKRYVGAACTMTCFYRNVA